MQLIVLRISSSNSVKPISRVVKKVEEKNNLGWDVPKRKASYREKLSSIMVHSHCLTSTKMPSPLYPHTMSITNTPHPLSTAPVNQLSTPKSPASSSIFLLNMYGILTLGLISPALDLLLYSRLRSLTVGQLAMDMASCLVIIGLPHLCWVHC